MTTQEAEQQIVNGLESGERLLWAGVPRQGLVLRSSDALVIPFTLLWGGFAFFWEFGVIGSGAPWFMALWGIPFVLIGLYIIVGRFFVDSAQRSRTAYGVTDRRIVIVSGLFSRTVRTLPVKTLTDVSLTEKSDGSGTITFGPTHPMAQWAGGIAWPGMGAYWSPCFEMISDAKAVHAQVRQAQANA
jgi:hypothetical protein